MAVKEVEFGRIDAESESTLAEYFIDIGSFGRLRTGRKSYVIGRKGSGKTAIFQTATPERLGHPVVKLDFLEYPWAAHNAIREEGVPEDTAFVASWRFLFLVTFCRYWADNSEGETAQQARNFLTDLFGESDTNWKHFLVDRFKRLRRIDLPSLEGMGGLGGIELEPESEGPFLARSASQWNDVLFQFAVKAWPKHPVSLMTDRLDDGWDASPNSKHMLVGVLKATRDLNLRIPSGNSAAPVITLLRSDIFDHLQFNDKNKISDDIERLGWDAQSLTDVINARIARSLNCPPNAAWNRIFSTDMMRQTASVRSYIIKRTMLRPRDMIAFCKKCQERAEANNHDIIETDDVYAAEVDYSDHMYNELDDEMHKQIPDARDLMQRIRDIGSTRFNFQRWFDAWSSRVPGITQEVAKEKLKILFDYSVVGIPRLGGAGGGTTFLYVYNDRLLEPDFRGDMAVHLSLKKTLKITEPRSS